VHLILKFSFACCPLPVAPYLTATPRPVPKKQGRRLYSYFKTIINKNAQARVLQIKATFGFYPMALTPKGTR